MNMCCTDLTAWLFKQSQLQRLSVTNKGCTSLQVFGVGAIMVHHRGATLAIASARLKALKQLVALHNAGVCGALPILAKLQPLTG